MAMTTPFASRPAVDPCAHLHGDRFTLVLPFPSSKQREALSPNGRAHWRKRHSATQTMKTAVIYMTRSALPPGHIPWARATITYRFYAPDRRGRDRDNYCAIMKPAVDGIVNGGLLTDDNWGVLTPGTEPMSELDRERPRVEIIIEKRRAS